MDGPAKSNSYRVVRVLPFLVVLVMMRLPTTRPRLKHFNSYGVRSRNQSNPRLILFSASTHPIQFTDGANLGQYHRRGLARNRDPRAASTIGLVFLLTYD